MMRAYGTFASLRPQGLKRYKLYIRFRKIHIPYTGNGRVDIKGRLGFITS